MATKCFSSFTAKMLFSAWNKAISNSTNVLPEAIIAFYNKQTIQWREVMYIKLKMIKQTE